MRVFDYKEKFRANFITTDPLTLNSNSLVEEELQIIVAAKRVDVIDGYAKSLNIDKFDLTSNYLIFSGIGNPKSFKKTLLQNKFKIFDEIIFPFSETYFFNRFIFL